MQELAKNKFKIGQKVYWCEFNHNKSNNKIYQLISHGKVIKIERSIEKGNKINISYLYIIMPYKKSERKLYYILEEHLFDDEQDAFNNSHNEEIERFIKGN